MEIVWSEQAEFEFAQNIEFLEAEWGLKSASDFFSKFNHSIETIKESPKRFQFHDIERGIQKCHVVKQITIYFKCEGTRVYLLSVFNNLQNPNRLDELK